MAIITTPVEGTTETIAGVIFTDGVGETSDEWAITYFTRHGYGVEDEPSDGDGLEKLKVDELRDLATSRGIALTATKKADVIAEIRAARASDEVTEDESPDGDIDEDTEDEES